MAVILGTLLGLTTIGSFIEYKSRQILLWLLHGAFLILWFIALTVLLGMTVWTEVRLFHRLREKDQTKNLEVSVVLDRWETAVWYSRHNDNNNHNVSNKTEDVIPSTWLCELQQRFNCTGFVHGCCIPELCYDLSAIPDYFYQVCPFCPPSDEAYYVYNKSNPDDGELVSNTTFYFGNQTCTTLITSNIHYHVLAFTIVVVVSYVLLWCGVALLYFTRQSSASLRRWGSTIVVEGG
ncbi:hypothetical protein AGDE_02606 [Angomonas deanei]|uniref:Tetraspanin family n=1 Tax=Angomonas deanei TaxID=59799 RepID=A0A7G2CMA9_9TRYP|nr:hypothetical protein AGDE_02606 [Angomonas deanei]CAD2220064.1 hypothetical protein, conserved [Angomonas deanei]|eukprot:EPY41319.1 hypothetical protein AGDE_02606 [Angomonas deanei]